MEKSNKILKNNEKAITLIALVVTIIVLLILARNKYYNVVWKQSVFYNNQTLLELQPYTKTY